jgi:predicted dehydrogenase
MENGVIGVGIIGASPDRGWAGGATIPALRALPDYELRAISTSRRETADRAASLFGVPLAFDNHVELVNRPEVDLVVINVRVPAHFELARAAIAAGKAIYCEWPLGNGLEEAVEMARLAKERGVLAITGLHGRTAPAVNFVRHLLADGYVGEVLSTSLIGSGMNWGTIVGQGDAYIAEEANGASLLTIGFGHNVDVLCNCLGEIATLNATMTSRRKTITVAETGEQIPMTTRDQLAVTGLLQSGAAVSMHYRGGTSRATNLLWEINGTEGDLRLTSYGGAMQVYEVKVEGGRGADTAVKPLEIPDFCHFVPASTPKGYPYNVAQAYALLARDFKEGSRRSATFDDGVVRHKLLRAIDIAAATGERQTYL